MELLLALVDLLKALAWPVLVGGFLWYFRQEVKTLFDRLKKLGAAGAEFDDAKQSVMLPKLDIDNLREFPNLGRTPFMGDLEKVLLSHLTLVNAPDQIPLLVRNLAQCRLELTFERIHSAIFNSQIEGLRKLEEAGGKVKKAEAETFFENVKSAYPDFYETLSFEQWASFLIRSDLIIIRQDEVQLLPLGKEYLLYLGAVAMPRKLY
jgi:hypothetical protein